MTKERWFTPEGALRIVADSPATLRPCDLDRLFDTYWQDRDAMRAYVVEHRPELADRIDSTIAELAKEYAQ
jgi:hypothetical protein